MSFRKFSNFRQRLQTVMPRPPQSANRLCFVLVQRDHIDAHARYIGVYGLQWPCCFTEPPARPECFRIHNGNAIQIARAH
jgi:hypothetical protein